MSKYLYTAGCMSTLLQRVAQLQQSGTTWRLYVLRLIHSSTAIFTLVSVQLVWRHSTTLQGSLWVRPAFVQQHSTRCIKSRNITVSICSQWLIVFFLFVFFSGMHH